MNVSSKQPLFFAQTDRLFLGEGLFETIRFTQYKPCYVALHWQRLQQSAADLGIKIPLSYSQWEQQIMSTIRHHSEPDGGIKTLLSGGHAERGLTRQGRDAAMVFDVFSYEIHQHPLRLVSAPWQRDAKNPVYGLKSVNYLEAILARRYAEEAGVDDALFFNTNGYVLETTVANFFIIKGKTLYTPCLSDGILPGVIRSRIIASSSYIDIDVQQKSLDKNSLNDADAVFICNALQGIQPVCSIDGRIYSDQHPLLNQLIDWLKRDATNIGSI